MDAAAGRKRAAATGGVDVLSPLTPWVVASAGRIGVAPIWRTDASAQKLALVDRTTKNKATADQIKTDFESVAKQVKGLGHAEYRPHTKLDLPDVDISALFRTRVDGFEANLKKLHKQYDDFPDDAKLALLDLVFNLGAGALETEWPKLPARAGAHAARRGAPGPLDVHARVLRVLERRGLLQVETDAALAHDSPALSACYEGAVTQRVGLGPMRAGP